MSCAGDAWTRRGAWRLALLMALWMTCDVVQGSAAAQSALPHATAQAPQSTPSARLPLTPGSQGASDGNADTLNSLRKSIDTGHAAEALQRIAAIRAQSGGDGQASGGIHGLDTVEGLALYAEGNLKDADAAFAAALSRDPNDIEAVQMRGLTLFGMGHPAEAIPLLQLASTKGALGKTDPNYVLALCYMDTRRYDDARHAFAAQFGFAPDGADAYLVAARMLFRREYLPVAQTFAEKALALNGTLPLTHELLGEIALAGNHLDEAIAEFEKEKARNPVEPSIYYRLGDAYLRAVRYDDAQRSLQEAVLLEPDWTGPYILLGKAMLKKGDPIAAVTYLRHADQMDATNFRTHSLLGQAYRGLGRTADASRETATAEKLQAATEPKVPAAQ
jgi:predicted Zn-dependent protease